VHVPPQPSEPHVLEQWGVQLLGVLVGVGVDEEGELGVLVGVGVDEEGELGVLVGVGVDEEGELVVAYKLLAQGPPQISFELPVHDIVHAVLNEEVVVVPHQHSAPN